MSIEVRKPESKDFLRRKKIFKTIFSVRSFDENMEKTNWKNVRKLGSIAYQLKFKEDDVEYIYDKIDNVECLITKPNKIENNNVIYYIHGGGFVAGSAKGSKSYCSMLASHSGSVVVACEYSLAPEHPFPEGFNDCVKVYESLIKKYESIFVIGDSAGGNLSLAVTLKAKEKKIKIPSGVIVHSPVVDLSFSFAKNSDEDDVLVKKNCQVPLKKMYCPNELNLKRYELSPIFGDFKNFPPLFITCAGNETLRNDSEKLYAKSILSNVEAKLIIMENAFHDYVTIGVRSPETKQIFMETIDFIKENS